MKGTRSSDAGRERAPASVHILLVEDDDALRQLLALSLRERGCVVTECSSGMEMVRRISDYVRTREPVDFDLVISDIRMPGLTGLEALEGARELHGWPPTILITAFGDRETHEEARRLGAAAMLDKPFEIDDLLDAVDAALSGSFPPRSSPRSARPE